MESDVLGYFDYLLTTIKPCSLLSYRAHLCKTYNLHMFRDFHIDFPNVRDYVTKLGMYHIFIIYFEQNVFEKILFLTRYLFIFVGVSVRIYFEQNVFTK